MVGFFLPFMETFIMDSRNFSSAKAQTNSLIARLADRFGVDSTKLLKCLTTQVFKQSDGAAPSNEELMVLLLVCENFGLNPFNREIFAFRSKSGDIVPVVSLDGWCKIFRSQKDFNGMRFTFSSSSVKVPGYPGELPEYVECSMQLKGVDTPVVIQEFMQECFNEKSPVWRKWPRRMLRSRAFIQCARLAFSLTGLYDEGEEAAEDYIDVEAIGQTSARIESSASEKISVNQEKLETLVVKLVTFAQNQPNGWEKARQWINDKLDGDNKTWAENELVRRYQALKASLPQKAADLTEANGTQEVPQVNANEEPRYADA